VANSRDSVDISQTPENLYVNHRPVSGCEKIKTEPPQSLENLKHTWCM